MKMRDDIQLFESIKTKIQRKIERYLKDRFETSLIIHARSYGVTILEFSNIGEKKYLQAQELLHLLKAGVTSYHALYQLLITAEADNTNLVKRTLYSKGQLGEILKACQNLIPETMKNDTREMVDTPFQICFFSKTDRRHWVKAESQRKLLHQF